MHAAIVAVWAIGLAGALVGTLVILKLSQLVIRALIDIARLGVLTEQGARGIAANVAVIGTLPDFGVPAGELTHAAEQIRSALESLARRVEGA